MCICYNSKERHVTPTSYSTRSMRDSHGESHLTSRTTHKNSWTETDRPDNNNDSNSDRVTVNLKISRNPRENFRFFSLKWTGKSHRDGDSFILTSMEIFITLFEQETQDSLLSRIHETFLANKDTLTISSKHASLLIRGRK